MARFPPTLLPPPLPAPGRAGCAGQPGAIALPRAYAAPPPPGVPVRAVPVAYGGTCSAGPYTCALPAEAPLGSECSCPGLGAPSYGRVR